MDMDARRAEFVKVARELFLEQGVHNTTITQIACRAGVTRSLFYHYFPDKDAILGAVIDYAANDFMQQAEVWYRGFDHKNKRDSMQRIASQFMAYLGDYSGLMSVDSQDRNAALRQQFAVRVARVLSVRFERQVRSLKNSAWAKRLSHPRETYYVLIVGLLSLALREPDTPTGVLADLIANALCIDMED